MQQNRRLQIARFERQPGEWKAYGEDQYGEHCRCVDSWRSAALIVGQKNGGYMPGSPDSPADQLSFGEAGHLGQFRDK
jgi:hypothetical protein